MILDVITGDPANNVTDHIFEKIGYNLHKRPDHPLGIIKAVIGEYFDDKFGAGVFTQYDDQYPIVSTYANFDSVLVPPDHVSRSSNDTYYVDSREKRENLHSLLTRFDFFPWNFRQSPLARTKRTHTHGALDASALTHMRVFAPPKRKRVRLEIEKKRKKNKKRKKKRNF